jgi:hypothetical protein
MSKPITWREKHRIRNEWCDQLCAFFNYYYKTGKKMQIRIPLYTAQVLSTFGILDFNKIDFSESRVNIFENPSRTNNEELIYSCFDELIEKKKFVGDYMTEFRDYFNHEGMPF